MYIFNPKHDKTLYAESNETSLEEAIKDVEFDFHIHDWEMRRTDDPSVVNLYLKGCYQDTFTIIESDGENV